MEYTDYETRARGVALHKKSAERVEVLRAAELVGAAEASRRTGVPASTIRSWRRRAGESGPPAGANVSEWGELKEAAARDTWEAACEALAKVHELLAAGKTGDAQRAALTMAITLDKSLALEAAAAAARTRTGRLAESQAQQVVGVITAFLQALGVPLTDAIRCVLATLLRQVGNGQPLTVPQPDAEAARAEIGRMSGL